MRSISSARFWARICARLASSWPGFCRLAPPIALDAATSGEDCTPPQPGQAKVLAAWARLIAGFNEAPIASVAISSPLWEDADFVYASRRGMRAIVSRLGETEPTGQGNVGLGGAVSQRGGRPPKRREAPIHWYLM